MKRALVLFLLSCLAAAACSDDPAPASTATPPPADACAPGFSPGEGGFCREQVAADACPAGTRPKIGSAKCEPVGWTTVCPLGTHKDASGWGCVDAKVEPCTGSTRESVSSGACVPVGDCNAAFPPAGAIVVDPAATEDATHYKTIGAALAAATSGAIVAVSAGTYPEDVKIDKTVTLVGKCPSEVKITPASATDPGILVQKGATDVKISGVTVTGHIGGIAVFENSNAAIEEVVVENAQSFGIIVDSAAASVKRSKVTGTVLGPQNRGAWGISAGNSDVSIDDVDIVGGTDAIFAGTVDTQFSVSRLVASGQAPQSPNRSAGVYAYTGRITLQGSVLHDITGDGAIGAEGTKGMVEAHDTVIRDVKNGGSLARGYGAVAFNGGEVTLQNVSIYRAESVGLLARDSGSVVKASDTVIIGPETTSAVPDENLIVTSEKAGIGVEVDGKASMTLDGVAVIGAFGWGIYANAGATLSIAHCLVDGTKPLEPKRSPALPFAVGLQVAGATTTLDDFTVLRSLLTAVSAGKEGTITGSGLLVKDVTATTPVGTGAGIAVGDGGKVDLDGSAIIDSMSSGIFATRGEGALLHFARGTVHGTRTVPDLGFGHGVIVAEGAEIDLDRSAVFENAAVGVAADGGKARLTGAVIAKNPVALHAQGGSFVVESADDGDLGATEVRVSPDSKFVDNATKLGTGEIPLPSNILP